MLTKGGSWALGYSYENQHYSLQPDDYEYYEYYHYAFDAPARCTWTSNAFTHPSPDAVFASCVLALGFVSRVVRLFDTSSSICEKWLRTKPSRWLQCLGEKWMERATKSTNLVSRTWWKIITGVVIAVYIMGKATYDCIGSMLNQLLWLSFSLFYGTAKIFSWRATTSGAPGLVENGWGFGQIVPLLMLVQPLMALPELFSGKEVVVTLLHPAY